MPYYDKFMATDNLLVHLNPVVAAITDTGIKANYAGFLSVSAITVYELAIKEIFIDFAIKKNAVFGGYIQSKFSQINGRIKLANLRDDHIKPFGQKYLDKFEKKLKVRETILLSTVGKDLRSSYSNLILCRHQYVHEGAPTLSYPEVVNNYNYGKDVIHSLFEAMQR